MAGRRPAATATTPAHGRGRGRAAATSTGGECLQVREREEHRVLVALPGHRIVFAHARRCRRRDDVIVDTTERRAADVGLSEEVGTCVTARRFARSFRRRAVEATAERIARRREGVGAHRIGRQRGRGVCGRGMRIDSAAARLLGVARVTGDRRDELGHVARRLPPIEAFAPHVGLPIDRSVREELADLGGRVGPLLVTVDHHVPHGIAAVVVALGRCGFLLLGAELITANDDDVRALLAANLEDLAGDFLVGDRVLG